MPMLFSISLATPKINWLIKSDFFLKKTGNTTLIIINYYLYYGVVGNRWNRNVCVPETGARPVCAPVLAVYMYMYGGPRRRERDVDAWTPCRTLPACLPTCASALWLVKNCQLCTCARAAAQRWTAPKNFVYSWLIKYAPQPMSHRAGSLATSSWGSNN